MPGQFETAQALADVYAESLLQSLATPERADTVADQFDGVIECMRQDKSLAAFMTSAAIDIDDRRQSLRRIFGDGRIDQTLLNLLLVLNDRGRLELIEAIHTAYKTRLDARRGRVKVRVTTAVPLGDRLREQIRRAVGSYTGSEPELVESVDPSIIGGIIIEYGDKRIDGSVQRRLVNLGEGIVRRGAAEIDSGRDFVVQPA